MIIFLSQGKGYEQEWLISYYIDPSFFVHVAS